MGNRPDVLENLPDLDRGPLQHLGLRVVTGCSAGPACSLQAEAERDESLLRAVVEVAFDPVPRRIARLHDPGSGCLDVIELSEHLASALAVESQRYHDELSRDLVPIFVPQDPLAEGGEPLVP